MSRLVRVFLILALSAAIAGCAQTPTAWLHTYDLSAAPSPERLSVCTAFGCLSTADASLSPEDWDRVRNLFNPPPEDAAAERMATARAVGLLEDLVGAQVGTDMDEPKDMTVGGDTGQLDCIAEAANTTVYLLLMARDGLLPRHRVAPPAHRGVFIFFPHNTAVLEELESGEYYVVDSWYGANGEAARVWTLAAWKSWDTDGDDPGVLVAHTGRPTYQENMRRP